jgi:HK97 family phage major capsid protein
MTTPQAPTRLSTLRAEKQALLEEAALLTRDGTDLEGEQADRFDEIEQSLTTNADELETLERRARRIEELQRQATGEVPGTPYTVDDDPKGPLTRAQNDSLRALEREEDLFSATSKDRQDSLIRRNPEFAEYYRIHSSADYVGAWRKLLTYGEAGASVSMSDSERGALAASMNHRAQSETVGSGGYAIPVMIDPSIILSNQETQNPFLQLARVVDITTNAWKGVSSAGVSWSFDAEAAEVSDDSLTSIVQPSVTVFMARGFVPFSIEISEDWPGFQSEMARVLGIGYDELLVDKFSRGSGSGEPRGILTALAASSPTVIVTSTTDGAFGQEDVYATWAALPQKFRRRASWMMSVDVMDRIRQMGTSNVYHAATVNLTQGQIDNLLGRPVYENPYFPVFSSTTGASSRLVVGAWDEFVVARRTGMTAELVPMLFGTDQRPTGQRGFFAYGRVGSNSVLDAAFALQANT